MNNAERTGITWERKEIILAYELYSTLSGSNTINNPQVIALAEILKRNPGSVKAMVENIKSSDPSYTQDGKVGLPNKNKQVDEVVKEFMGNLGRLSDEVDDIRKEYGLESEYEIYLGEMVFPEDLENYDVERLVRVRRGQSLFRQTLLKLYNRKCCVTGLAIPDMLRASHIKPWAKSDDDTEKTNPENGLLLNALYDSAFDRGYITIDPDKYKIVISPELKKHSNDYVKSQFGKYEGRSINLPERSRPGERFIEYHNDYVYEQWKKRSSAP